MIQKNVAGQTWLAFAFVRATGAPVVGDAANIDGKLCKDGGAATALTTLNPTEVERGYYKFALSQAETNANILDLLPNSASAGVQVVPVQARIQTSQTSDTPGAGVGDRVIVVEVTTVAYGLTTGAKVTLQTTGGATTRWGVTGGDGKVTFNISDGTYTLLVSAGASFNAYSTAITVSANATFVAALVDSGVVAASVASTTTGTTIYRLKTATDWILDLNVGALGAWSQIRFTAKGSLIDDTDAVSMLHVRLTNPANAADGLVYLNGAVAGTPAHGSITVLNATTGDIRVLIKAAATDIVRPTDEKYWLTENDRIGGTKVWRRPATGTATPPWYHYDAKVLDGASSAREIKSTALGYIIAVEAATQTVV